MKGKGEERGTESRGSEYNGIKTCKLTWHSMYNKRGQGAMRWPATSIFLLQVGTDIPTH